MGSVQVHGGGVKKMSQEKTIRNLRSPLGWLAVFLIFAPLPDVAQTLGGELWVRAIDPQGRGVPAQVQLRCGPDHVREAEADALGNATIHNLPLGECRLEVKGAGFESFEQTIAIRGVRPVRDIVQLKLSTVRQTVTVSADGKGIDPEEIDSAAQIGTRFIRERMAAIPGRSLQNLVNSQPGWLFEGNAVLHPRGSEYQTQFVMDGIPLTENVSPGLGNEVEANDVQSMTIYTAGIPAQFGRKLGGVIELNTFEDLEPGLHGEAVLSGGSYGTAGAFGKSQYTWGRNALGGTASASRTDHYLNPVTPQNYTNTGNVRDLSGQYEFDPSANDRLRFTLRREAARYQIPNEQVQEDPQLVTELGQPAPPQGTPSQLQTNGNFETMGTASYRHIFTQNLVMDARDMARTSSNDYRSNAWSWPIRVFQHNRFNQEYFNTTVEWHQGHGDWTAGIESDNKLLKENYSDQITADPSYPGYPFDPGTEKAFAFTASRPDLEEAAFLQNVTHLGNWTVSAGLRWDHYQLLLNRAAFSPRISAGHYFPGLKLVLHASYDRVFQTPTFENILLSSSAQVNALEPGTIRLPVQPSRGNYYEAGVTKSAFARFKVDANVFRRYLKNFADDNQLLNTNISFPIAFRKGMIYGAEGRVAVSNWRRISGFLSYSYEVGNVWFPVTGGLFLGQDAGSVVTQRTGHFPDTQDQRNTIRWRARYQVNPRLWIAGGAQYNSGVPFDFNGTQQEALAEYGQQVLSRVNFDRGRIDPALLASASVGAEVYKSGHVESHFQVDGENLNNVLDVIDFGGLFSGNAIGPSRSVMVRLTTDF